MAKIVTLTDGESNKCYPRTVKGAVLGLPQELKRIDNLVSAISSGATTDMTEVIDARVVNGVEYDTLYDAINGVNDKVDNSIVVKTKQTSNVLSDFINTDNRDVFKIIEPTLGQLSTPNSHIHAVCTLYDENQKLISDNILLTSNNDEVDISAASFIRIRISYFVPQLANPYPEVEEDLTYKLSNLNILKAEEKAINNLEEKKAESFKSLDDLTSAKMKDIDALTNTQMENINTLSSSQIDAINNTAQAQINAISNGAANQLSTINNVAASKVRNLDEVTNTKIGDINSSGSSQVNAINNTAQAQINAINNTAQAQASALDEQGEKIKNALYSVQKEIKYVADYCFYFMLQKLENYEFSIKVPNGYYVSKIKCYCDNSESSKSLLPEDTIDGICAFNFFKIYWRKPEQVKDPNSHVRWEIKKQDEPDTIIKNGIPTYITYTENKNYAYTSGTIKRLEMELSEEDTKIKFDTNNNELFDDISIILYIPDDESKASLEPTSTIFDENMKIPANIMLRFTKVTDSLWLDHYNQSLIKRTNRDYIDLGTIWSSSEGSASSILFPKGTKLVVFGRVI